MRYIYWMVVSSIDDALSKPLFRASLPGPVEWIFSFPGACFGVPGVIAGPLLALSGSCGGGVPLHWQILTGALVLLYLAMFNYAVVRFAATPDDDKSYQKLLGFHFPIPLAIFLLAAYTCPESVTVAMQHYSVTTLSAQILIVVLKRSSRRRRPCARTDLISVLAPRAVSLSAFVATPKYANESFPSGDAAQAAIFTGTLVAFGYSQWWLLLTLLACSGRVYFHCHHVADTAVGAAVAATVSSLVARRLHPGAEALPWWVLTAATTGFLVAEKVIRRLVKH